jgi:predicted nucleic acid-binding protein
MPKPELFMDSSALFAGIVSPSGAARALLMLAETDHIQLIISEQVIAETERAIARKIPLALDDVRLAILNSNTKVVLDPSPAKVQKNLNLIQHNADVPIILSAMEAQVDFLVTLNRKHFIDDPEVSEQSGLRIGTPGDALARVREWLSV